MTASHLVRHPVSGRHSVGYERGYEPRLRRGGCLRQKRRRRHHRVQQRQGKRRPVPRKKVRRTMCFFAMNMVSSFAAQRTAVCRATSAPLMLFWNGALLTMLSTSVEKR